MKRLFVFVLAAAAMLPSAAFAQTTENGAAPQTNTTCAAGEPMVWLNTKSHKYHYPGSAVYGKTKHGKMECESAAKAEGGIPAKDAKPQ